jgi:hypothetical protein
MRAFPLTLVPSPHHEEDRLIFRTGGPEIMAEPSIS